MTSSCPPTPFWILNGLTMDVTSRLDAGGTLMMIVFLTK